MITAILNLYDRPENLALQIAALREQTITVDKIIVWQNKDVHWAGWWDDGEVEIIRSQHNYKYHGRFSAALLAETEFVAVIDDDTIPGPKYLEHAIQFQQATNGLIVGLGSIYHGSNYMDRTFHGWPNEERKANDVLRPVDYGGCSWVFNYEHAHLFFSERLATTESGEDHHFSYVLQKHGIRTFVIPQDDKECNAAINGQELGSVKASSATDHNLALRQSVMDNYLSRGWGTINKI